MEKIMEMLPFLIPVIIVELVLLAVTIRHILTHKTYKRGNRAVWLIIAIVGMQIIGPVLYFTLGRENGD